MSCPFYKEQRKQMLAMIFQKFPNTVNLNEEHIFLANVPRRKECN